MYLKIVNKYIPIFGIDEIKLLFKEYFILFIFHILYEYNVNICIVIYIYIYIYIYSA